VTDEVVNMCYFKHYILLVSKQLAARNSWRRTTLNESGVISGLSPGAEKAGEDL
jgi:hypothetical protein